MTNLDFSARRIRHDIETLSRREYTLSDRAICRYAYTDVYQNTLNYFRGALDSLGFKVYDDPVGTLVARNRPPGTPVFGLGSHCDSNRNGGKYDGTLGVVCALEVCRLNHDLDLDLPLQLISFLEEEGSGFGQTMLGSRIAAQRVTEEELKQIKAIDDGRSFWEHAEAAGHSPEQWKQAKHILDDLVGWIELHIEQGRVLQDSSHRIGIVTAIVGYAHGDLTIHGRADHAGGTPIESRFDAGLVAAETMLELERLAQEASVGAVATVGEIDLEPGIINVVPGKARISIDVRSLDGDAVQGISRDIRAFADRAARRRGMTVEYEPRQSSEPTPMDDAVLGALERAAMDAGAPYILMPSGACHDTMFVAPYAPASMIFVPCKDGISHSPLEEASSEDAALGAALVLNAIQQFV